MRPRRPQGVTFLAGEEGATLVELMVSVAILAVVMSGVASGMKGALNLSRNDRNRIVAANLATQVMEEARSTEFTTLQPGASGASNVRTTTETVGGVAYTVTREISWVGQDANADVCSSTGQPSFLRARASVAWPRMAGVDPVTSESVFAPPGGVYTPNSGHIGAQVTDVDGEPVAGHLVTLNGPSGQRSLTTTEGGCAFFAFLPEGLYQLSLNSAGYVDAETGSQQVVQDVTVTVGATSEAAFSYDRAASVTLTLQGAQGGTVPPSLPVSLYNDKVVPSGILEVGGTGTTRTVDPLFPFPGGYDAWAGGCSDADPGVNDRVRIDSAPGSAGSATVPLASVQVTVRAGGNPVVNAAVTARDSCGSELALGVTDASGTITFALPQGTWTFTTTAGASQTRLLELGRATADTLTLVNS
jgi:type II secretory pathway pseudopilin PulG